ncbi:MAG TPA: M28 family peptidase, partial [Patescibacteria group bacterium]|nr:M28 family peptidase [Patescibacteria group bacterium]
MTPICLMSSLLIAVLALTDPASRLSGRAMGATPMLDDLRELCDRIGGRPTGSPACERSVDWALARFRSAGIDSATESFRVPSLWLPGSAEASVTAPEVFSLRVAAAPYSASTPSSGPIDARLVDAGNGAPEDFEKLKDKARGAVALVRTGEMKTLADLFDEYIRTEPMVKAAQKAGVAGLLLMSTRPKGLLYRHPVGFDGTSIDLPVAMVSREQAARLARLSQKGEVRVRLSIRNKIGPAYESRNVVAEIRGREKPEEVVLLGAHLDSWDLGTGALDNGVNAALVIDVARGMKELGLAPRRTVRFVLFTGEEQGMLGSAGYVHRHAAELDHHVGVVVLDVGSGRINGFYLNGREELRGRVAEALGPVAGLGPFRQTLEALDGTDNFDFLLSGVPNLVADQDAAPYLPDYHAESDVFEQVDGREAMANESITSALVWALAEDASRPVGRQTRAEVEALIMKAGLDGQMK